MNNLWVEKYRPNDLNKIHSHNENLYFFIPIKIYQNLPHLQFYGSPGCGKTSIIHALAKDILKKIIINK